MLTHQQIIRRFQRSRHWHNAEPPLEVTHAVA
jgi:hypothetical protein